MSIYDTNVTYDIQPYDTYGTRHYSVWVRVEGDCVAIHTFVTRKEAENFVNSRN